MNSVNLWSLTNRDSRHISLILLAILTEGFVVFSCFVCSDKGLNFYNIIYLVFKKQKSTWSFWKEYQSQVENTFNETASYVVSEILQTVSVTSSGLIHPGHWLNLLKGNQNTQTETLHTKFTTPKVYQKCQQGTCTTFTTWSFCARR